jgi:hypothetical protein
MEKARGMGMSQLMMDLLSQVQRQAQLAEDDYRALLKRYDDALKRMNDMQAELEYLRLEVNRG